ncbi:EutP/PduV family microcompartment system protein [Desulfotomaculum sp. 1211_IL3151]|uniref:EutP/PduV family microcompartment system protein n=1 Tax=Desulfotomaculum sp. 1211_IL3151 TaxID=3084055 RepID=UPI002FD8920D
MGRAMMVGAVGAGKSTLIAALKGDSLNVRKTQAMEFDSYTVDTPGEYIENPRFYRALMATALQVKDVLFLQDATSERCIYPPGIAQSFPCSTIGVITKIDHPEANIEKAKQLLKTVALKSNDVYVVSAINGQGIKELKERLARE